MSSPTKDFFQNHHSIHSPVFFIHSIPSIHPHPWTSPHLPSGKRLHNYGKSPNFSWENSLYLWPFSIANCWHNQRVPLRRPAMMVLGASYFTGDRPKSTSSGMSSSAPPPVARMGTMKRSRLARAAGAEGEWGEPPGWAEMDPGCLVVICGENGDNDGDMMRIIIYIHIYVCIYMYVYVFQY